MKLIGLSGTNGSGKDTVGHMLAERHNFLFISVTDLLRAEATRREQPAEREVLRTISAEWRRESGLGVLIDKAVEAYGNETQQYEGLVVASLRNPGEADRVHKLGGIVVWVDADPRVRYDRVQANKDARGRAAEDNKTFEQFSSEEAAEMTTTGDEATLNMCGVKAKCDLTIINDGHDVAAFIAQAEKVLFS